MSGKDGVVVERLCASERGGPAIERTLPDKRMDAVVNEVLRDEDAVVRKSHHQRNFGFGMLEMKEFETNAVDDFRAWRHDMVGTFRSGRNGVSMLLMLFGCNAVADSLDFGRDGAERVDRT